MRARAYAGFCGSPPSPSGLGLPRLPTPMQSSHKHVGRGGRAFRPQVRASETGCFLPGALPPGGPAAQLRPSWLPLSRHACSPSSQHCMPWLVAETAGAQGLSLRSGGTAAAQVPLLPPRGRGRPGHCRQLSLAVPTSPEGSQSAMPGVGATSWVPPDAPPTAQCRRGYTPRGGRRLHRIAPGFCLTPCSAHPCGLPGDLRATHTLLPPRPGHREGRLMTPAHACLVAVVASDSAAAGMRCLGSTLRPRSPALPEL